MEHMKDVVQNYASAFNSTSSHMTLADRNASLTTKSTTTTLKRQQSKKRIRGTKEITRDQKKPSLTSARSLPLNTMNATSDIMPVKKNSKKCPTCSFCSETGHRCSNCTVFKGYERNATVSASNNDRYNLVTRLCHYTKLSPALEVIDKTLVTNLETKKNNAHFVIHKVYSKHNEGDGQKSMDNLNFLVSFISTGGLVQDNDKYLLVDGKEIYRIIMYANSMKTKKIYIFDETTHSQLIASLVSNTEGTYNKYEDGETEIKVVAEV